MFAADDEDGDFLSPTGGAKLASLFGLDQATSQGNESFQYTAPKQPRKSSANSGKTTNIVNTLFFLCSVNGQYVKQGKLGAAVLGNHTTKEYKILLYVSQQKQVTAARIHSGFILTVQPSNYCTFYDDQRQNWSLMFESEKAATDFCKEVCLAKVNCSGALDSVLIQDLVLGEGQAVENGDSLEVAYTGWLLLNHTIGQVKISLSVSQGWEEGMLNMRKGGKRLMVIPPSLAYGSQGVDNRVPPDSTLVFEAEIRRVKFAKDGSSRDSAAPSPAPSVESLAPTELNQPFSTAPPTSKPSEAPLRAKSNSLNEQVSNPDATKAKLISRMAKMGQPMLPFITGPASSSSQPDSSDSELEDASVSRLKERSSAPSPQPVHISSGPPPSMQALLPVTMATANPQPMMPGAVHAFQPVSQMYPTQTVTYQGTSEVTSFLMTEARQHNTEIRLAVGKVADKLDHLSSKINDLQKQGSVSLGLSNVSMETAMIMHNIQRIIQENECLKKEVFEKSSRIEEQNCKIGELINQNQRYVEQSNQLMEQRNDSLKNSSEQSQTRILQAEQNKVTLLKRPIQHTRNNTRTARFQKPSELPRLIYCLMCVFVSELKETADRVQSQYKMEKQKRKELELKFNNMEEELQDMKTEKDSLERTLSERKRKWQLERQRCDEELEEVRRAGQQELDNLRSQLRKARTSTDQAAAEQLSQLQADLEQEWQVKCDQALAAAREQQRREMTELSEHRDALQLKLTQLQDKFTTLKQSRESEEQLLLQQQDQKEELQALREKVKHRKTRFAAQSWITLYKLSCDYFQVKRVMNGVFQSLRAEFDLNETYTGSAVLRVLVSTIKNVTLQLLTKKVRSSFSISNKCCTFELVIPFHSFIKLERVEDRSEQEVVEERSEEKVVEEKEVEVTERDVQDQDSESGTETKGDEETESDIKTKQEVTPEPPEDISPTQEAKVIDESVTAPLDEPESTHMTLGGPPKTPPPPPPAPQDTSALLSSPSERVEEENGGEPFFQSSTPPQPPSAPTASAADEEEEELVSRALSLSLSLTLHIHLLLFILTN
uniref:peptidylprolyl isomerase n=1 Tax=Sinocyclocheilus grahami TaxID=75366 RepID=A0A672SJQ1_SINGR